MSIIGIPGAYALITCGGTKARVDAVRSMANDAEGDVGVEIARQFDRAGIPSVLVMSRFAWFKHRHDLPKTAVPVVFNYVDEYMASIDGVLAKYGRPAFAVSTAAVSDYGHLGPVAGKISSDKDVLELSIPRLPKVLDTWREKFGKECVIVGFKFLTRANASLQDLFAAARRQNARGRLNATVGNFKEEIGGGKHPVWWITPDGGAVRMDGWRDEVAGRIVEFCVRYRNTTWARSERIGERTALGDSAEERFASDIIRFGQEARLLTGTSGNVSVSLGGRILVSPRGTDKSAMRSEDMLVASLDPAARVVRFNGPEGRKPSIDSHVLLLLAEATQGAATLHFHDGWVVGNAPVTRKAYPCGTAEQAAMIQEALAARVRSGGLFTGDGRAIVELRDHGHMLFLRDERAVRALAVEWEEATLAYLGHLRDVGRRDLGTRVSLAPIFDGTSIVGVVAKLNGWHSFFLLPGARGRRLGDEILDLVNRRGTRVAVHDLCQVRDFYLARGFRAVDGEGADEGMTVLDPPSVREDLRDSVTLVLHNPVTDRVLLVRRSSSGSYPDYWACPGGRSEDSDASPYATGVRETGEEVGIDLRGTVAPDRHTVHYTGWTNPATGQTRGSRVTNLVVETLVEHVPTVDGVEIVEARWASRTEARALRMGPATRAVLRKAWPDF